jgi:hypothetical protein
MNRIAMGISSRLVVKLCNKPLVRVNAGSWDERDIKNDTVKELHDTSEHDPFTM